MEKTKWRRIYVIDLVGIAEIAARADVTKQAVTNWQTRHEDFPQPLVMLDCGPVYNWPEVQKWLVATGRS